MPLLLEQKPRSEVQMKSASADVFTMKRTMSPRQEGDGGDDVDLDERD